MAEDHNKTERKKPERKQDGRGNRLAASQKRINNRSFTLPEGRDEPNNVKITLMIRLSAYEKCRVLAGDKFAQFIRDAIDFYLDSLDKKSRINSPDNKDT